MHIVKRTTAFGTTPGVNTVEWEIDNVAGVSTCTLPSMTKCSNIKMEGNIVAGAGYAGFTAMGASCTDREKLNGFKNNVAHSIAYSTIDGKIVDGNGAIFYPDS